MADSTPPFPEASVPEQPVRQDYRLPDEWALQLGDEFEKGYWCKLQQFVEAERKTSDVYPPQSETFAAFGKTPFECVDAVVLGQDPYHSPGQARGVAFSVHKGRAHAALAEEAPQGTEARPRDRTAVQRQPGWLGQTGCPAAEHHSHKSSQRGRIHQDPAWEIFTDEAIRALSRRSKRVVFLLFGGPANAKRELIDESVHSVIETAHPQARLNAKNPLVSSSAFSRANADLAEFDRIDWSRFDATRDSDLTAWSGGHGSRVLSRERLGDLGREGPAQKWRSRSKRAAAACCSGRSRPLREVRPPR